MRRTPIRFILLIADLIAKIPSAVEAIKINNPIIPVKKIVKIVKNPIIVIERNL